jgi:hypothetical protein
MSESEKSVMQNSNIQTHTYKLKLTNSNNLTTRHLIFHLNHDQHLENLLSDVFFSVRLVRVVVGFRVASPDV